MDDFVQKIANEPCTNCRSPSLMVEKAEDLVEDLAKLAEQSDADVEVVSMDTEEGQMLKNAFGGIAGILRYRL
jgi:peptide chain release factor subunit 1